MAGGQRRALGALFLFLAVLFAGIGYAALLAGVWVIAAAGVALALWIGSFGLRALLVRRAR
ncbi:MAG: hypothetical protein AABM30_11440 [Actinomycetota bacterium]